MSDRCSTAIVIALTGLAAILLFWAVVLLAALGHFNASVLAPSESTFLQYWYAFVGAVFGTAFTLGGVFITRRMKEREARAKLVERIRFNRERLEQVRGYLANNTVPSFPLDTTGLIIWLHSSSGLLKQQLIDDIDGHRYQLDHIHNKMQMVFSYFSSRCAGHAGNAIPASAVNDAVQFAAQLGLTQQLDAEIIRGAEIMKRIEGL